MNRIDKTVVFKMLRPDDMKHILDIELAWSAARAHGCRRKPVRLHLHAGREGLFASAKAPMPNTALVPETRHRAASGVPAC